MMNDDLGYDLTITQRSQPRDHDGGVWVAGRVAGYRLQALVFADHATDPASEYERTRISKLWLQRLADRHTTFNFDRGWDVPAQDPDTQAVVEFLGEGLADMVFAG